MWFETTFKHPETERFKWLYFSQIPSRYITRRKLILLVLDIVQPIPKMETNLIISSTIYYFFLILGILSNLLVLIYLIRHSLRKGSQLFTTLLFYLHFSLVAEEITTIPYLFKFSEGLCLAVEGLKFYFGLKNVLSILFLVSSYSTYIQKSSNFFIPQKVLIRVQLFLTIFPTITFLPYTNGVYTYPDDPWCSLPTNHNLVWVIFVQYLWVWLMLIFTLITNIRMITTLYYNYDPLLLNHYFSTVVTYSIVAWVSWIPRTVIRFTYYNEDTTNGLLFYSYFPVYIAGILFAALFFRNIPQVLKFEELMKHNQIDLSNNSIDWNIIVERNSQIGGVGSGGVSRSVSKNISVDHRISRVTNRSIFSPMFFVEYGMNFPTKTSPIHSQASSDKSIMELKERDDEENNRSL